MTGPHVAGPNNITIVRLGNLLMIVGAGIILIGVMVRFFPGLFTWFGSLPGDIRIETENSRVFIPFTSMLLLSVALTLVVSLARWISAR